MHAHLEIIHKVEKVTVISFNISLTSIINSPSFEDLFANAFIECLSEYRATVIAHPLE